MYKDSEIFIKANVKTLASKIHESWIKFENIVAVQSSTEQKAKPEVL